MIFTEIFYNHCSGVSSRDLSPVDMVREYWSDCKDEMVEDMERIYERYQNYFTDLTENISMNN